VGERFGLGTKARGRVVAIEEIRHLESLKPLGGREEMILESEEDGKEMV
jgi:hypothetical protein